MSSTSITYNTNVESLLARHLKIRFIDARTLATEAKLNLGINGYVSNSDDIERVFLESVKIFNNDRTDKDKHAMQTLKNTLDTIKRTSFAESSCSRSRSSMVSTASSISSDSEGDDDNDKDVVVTAGDDASFNMKKIITKTFSFGSTASNKKKGSSKLARRSLTNKGAQQPLQQKKEVSAAA